jgi:hypothetical protein
MVPVTVRVTATARVMARVTATATVKTEEVSGC